MQEFINNLIPRLKNLSKTLDQVEVFVDKAWVYTDENNNIHEYTFLRDQRLIVSFNGQIQKGKWELLPTGKLLLDIAHENMMLEKAFINKAILVLKKNGMDDQPFILFDIKKIPDGNITSYLEMLAENPMLHLEDETSGPKESFDYFDVTVVVISFIFIVILILVLAGPTKAT
ncbi:hypothetical protein [Daejeonella sp.]|uniref:hypothetical protein n=1 Tax=Daejeonella sp. TaxID=2805397 RepID=UPI002730F0AC|nr:hypothetical protein [Daejeonella sp.]MDP2413838.1 hypothetical protein [Daejeonella sp.]